jgi:hypothetical protein
MCQIIKKKWELPERAVDEIIELMPYLEIVKCRAAKSFFINGLKNLWTMREETMFARK